MRTYDPSSHQTSFLGNIVYGFADTEWIKVARTKRTFVRRTGAMGEGARARQRDRSGMVTITLLATSSMNDIFAAAHRLDEETNLGAGPFFMKDSLGTLVVQATNAWIEGIPDIERGLEVGEMEWVIDCEALEIFAGGALDLSAT